MRISDWSSDVCSSDLPETSSSSPPPPRTSAKWPSFFRCRSRQLPPEAHESCRRAPVPLSASISNALFQRYRPGSVVRPLVRNCKGGHARPYRRAWDGPDVLLKGRNAHPPSRLFRDARSEEHTSELQSLMRISYAVFCLKKKKKKNIHRYKH